MLQGSRCWSDIKPWQEALSDFCCCSRTISLIPGLNEVSSVRSVDFAELNVCTTLVQTVGLASALDTVLVQDSLVSARYKHVGQSCSTLDTLLLVWHASDLVQAGRLVPGMDAILTAWE